MEWTQLEVLHEHYRDSCSLMHSQRAARDRYFYLVVAVVAVLWFDVAAPKDFAAIAGDALKAQMGLSAAPDLAYLRSVLSFLLLGLTVRYFQVSVWVERNYCYVQSVEEVLAAHVDAVFTREGKAYSSNYPAFLTWAHYLYVVAVPAVLLLVVIFWSVSQMPDWNLGTWSGLTWFNLSVSSAILISIVLYWASRRQPKSVDARVVQMARAGAAAPNAAKSNKR